MKESYMDVLIIGAGPAGLMAANGFAREGVNVRVVDKRPLKVAAGQADGIQPRTIEVFQSYGLAERLLREGNQMHMAAFYNPSPSGGIQRDGRAMDVTAPTAKYPFEVTLHQGAIEAIFLDSMRNFGLETDRPVQPTAMELSEDEGVLADPQSYAVKVVLKHLDVTEGEEEEEIVHAKYVLGADGAHSWVRKALGITMDGEQTDYVWGVVDTIPVTNFPDIRNRCAIHSPTGSCMIIPREGDVVRLYLQLTEGPDDVKGVDGRVDRSKWGPARLLEVARKALHPWTIEFPNEIDWWTLYIIGQRVASSFTKHERIFIAGDACHTHSPKAGQGMNASMNDSHNLVWKITHVLRDWAKPSLLKTYEFERRKYAQDLIDFDKKFSALFSGKPRTDEFQDGVSHAEFLEAFQTFGGFTSGIGIQYSSSPITLSSPASSSSSPATNLTPGTRMPPSLLLRAADARPTELQDLLPSDGRFKLVLFVGALEEEGEEGEERRGRVKVVERGLVGDGEDGDGEGVLRKYGARLVEWVDILSVMVGSKVNSNFTSVPEGLRTHWSKVYIDEIQTPSSSLLNPYTTRTSAYCTYGLSPSLGAIVIVRPDGYIGAVTSLDAEGVNTVDEYFAGFLLSVDFDSEVV